MNDRKRFENIRTRWCKSREAERAYRLDVLYDRYRDRQPPVHWLTATERRRLDTFRRAQDRASDTMFALLDRIGGRSWKSLIPHHWVMEELTFEDAITRGRLSVVPPCGYGARPRDVEVFSGARDSECAGECGADLDPDMGPYCPECQQTGRDPLVRQATLTTTGKDD